MTRHLACTCSVHGRHKSNLPGQLRLGSFHIARFESARQSRRRTGVRDESCIRKRRGAGKNKEMGRRPNRRDKHLFTRPPASTLLSPSLAYAPNQASECSAKRDPLRQSWRAQKRSSDRGGARRAPPIRNVVSPAVVVAATVMEGSGVEAACVAVDC